MLKRKQYLALFRTESHTDSHTGRERQVVTYVGPWYGFRMGEPARRGLCGWLLGAWALAVGAFIAVGFANAEGSRCFYVLPFYLFLLFPMFYWGYGAVRLARCKARFTEVDKDEGVDRVRVSALSAAILSGLHTAGEIVLLCLGGGADALAREIFSLAGVALTGVLALVALRLVARLEPIPEPDAPNPAG